MSEHALPSPFRNYSFPDILAKTSGINNTVIANDTSGGYGNVSKFLPDVITLTVKNVCTIHALVNIAYGLGSMLGSAWYQLLQTFEKLDFIFNRTVMLYSYFIIFYLFFLIFFDTK